MSIAHAYCKVSIAPVRFEARDSSEMTTQLLFGEVVDVLEKEEKWWNIRTLSDNYSGWVDPKQIQSLTKKEVNRWLDGLSFERALTRTLRTERGNQTILRGSFVPFTTGDVFSIGEDNYVFIDQTQPIVARTASEIALDYLNAPYLWGGKTPFGIDCSGLVQNVFRLLDYNLPRDACQQEEYGSRVDFNDAQDGDVAFFSNDKGKVIHTGILYGTNKIIHASGYVRINELNKTGIIHDKEGYITHHLSSLKRMI